MFWRRPSNNTPPDTKSLRLTTIPRRKSCQRRLCNSDTRHSPGSPCRWRCTYQQYTMKDRDSSPSCTTGGCDSRREATRLHRRSSPTRHCCSTGSNCRCTGHRRIPCTRSRHARSGSMRRVPHPSSTSSPGTPGARRQTPFLASIKMSGRTCLRGDRNAWSAGRQRRCCRRAFTPGRLSLSASARGHTVGETLR